jgi:hypothetical protein
VSPADHPPLHREWVMYLRTLDELQLPVVDESLTLDDLRETASVAGESWPVRMLDRLRWERDVLVRLHRGAVEYGDRSFARPLSELLDELGEEAADLGAWTTIADHVLNARDDLEDEQRSLVAQALRDAAVAGARAWARIDQARALLAGAEGDES